MSFASDVAKLPLGSVAIPLMALDAAGGKTHEVLKKGDDPREILGKATISGLAKGASKEFPIDVIVNGLQKELSGTDREDYYGYVRDALNQGKSYAEADLYAVGVSFWTGSCRADY